MKKLSILLILLFVVNLSSFAQKGKKPNYKKIEKEIKKKKSDFYYPKIWKKFMDADPDMSLDEKRYLYYGHIFQPSYSAYGHGSKFSDSLRTLIQIDSIDDQLLNLIVSIADSVIEADAFDLRARNYQLYALEELGNELDYAKKLTQIRIIIHAILSSGDGISQKTAFYVFNISHEYFMLGVLGYDFGGSQSLIGQCDYLKVEKNEDEIEGIYFDISPSLNSLKNMFK